MKDISLIIARILLKVAKKDEVDAISKWKHISEKNSLFTENLETFWDHPAEEKSLKRLEAARKRLLLRLNSKGERRSGKSTLFYLSRIAAAIVLAISIAGLSIYFASETDLFYKNNWVEISTEAGQRSQVFLPDGSLVWLNAETVVKYRPDKDGRKVSLTGEAYFEVSHSANDPFIVETGDTEVKVLGTKFNVSHYPDSKITEASLLSGKITMSITANNEFVELKPGEKVIYHANEQSLSRKDVKVQNEILWRQGILVFENEPFNELIHKLERYYAVEFNWDKPAFENIHYTGSIDNLSINKVLEFINLTIPIHYDIENKTIKLKLKK